MVELVKLAPRSAAVTVSLFWVALTFGRLLVAYVSEKLGYRLTILFCCIGAFFVSAFGLMETNALATAILFVALGFFLSGIFPTVMAQGTSFFPYSTGSVAGILMAAGAMGRSVIPWLIGTVSDVYNLRSGMGLVPLGCGLMLVLSLINMKVTIPQRNRAFD